MLWTPPGFQPSRAAFDGAALGPDTTTGLVSYWLMNDGSGSTYVDSISARNGSLTSSALWNAGGWIDFDGTNFGQVNDHADFTGGATLTVFAWIKGAAQSNTGLVAHYDFTTDNRGWAVLSDNAGSFNTLLVQVSDDGTSNSGHRKTYHGSQVCLDGTWHSIAMRFNAGVLDLFVDGTKDSSPTKSEDPAITTIFDADDQVAMGSLTTGSPYTGAMKKVRYYSNAKSDADIAAIHALGA